MPLTCPPSCKESIDRLDDVLSAHDARLKDKRDRILKLELEAKHMQEKLDKMATGQERILEAVNSLKSWQTYLMGSAAFAAVVYGLASAHWAGIVRLLGG